MSREREMMSHYAKFMTLFEPEGISTEEDEAARCLQAFGQIYAARCLFEAALLLLPAHIKAGGPGAVQAFVSLTLWGHYLAEQLGYHEDILKRLDLSNE